MSFSIVSSAGDVIRAQTEILPAPGATHLSLLSVSDPVSLETGDYVDFRLNKNQNAINDVANLAIYVYIEHEPTLRLLGAPVIEVTTGTAFLDPGVVAEDLDDGALPVQTSPPVVDT